MIGYGLREFLVHLEAWLEKNGCLSSEDFAEKCGEVVTVIYLVRQGKHKPTEKMLKYIDWVSVEDEEWKLIRESRYMPRKLLAGPPNEQKD